MRTLNRRDLLRGAALGAVVAGWDPVTRSWATASTGGAAALTAVPALDGVFLTDPASKSLAADDYGHIVHHEPFAVLRPLSVQDVVKMVEFARRHSIRVSMRGQGHSTYGQSQAAGGIVIDSATLNRIHEIRGDRMTVDAGATWRGVVLAAAAHGLTPPVLTDYLGLSVGGTLSLGGIGGGPARQGAQVDNVFELDVVTGEGELVTCSPAQHQRLFESVLGGLGQCGVIVRATVRLVPMPTHALLVQTVYEDLDTSLADMAMLVSRDRDYPFSSMDQWAQWVTGKGWVYQFSAAAYFTPPHVPDSARLVAGLRGNSSQRVITTIPYLTWLSRIDPVVAASHALRYALFNGLVPESAAPGFFSAKVFSQTDQELGTNRVLFVPFSRAQMKRPLLSLSNSDVQQGLAIFRRVREESQVQPFLYANRDLYNTQTALGGKRYPWDAIPDFTRADWAEHYGKSWSFFRGSKRLYDPAGILGPGAGVFG